MARGASAGAIAPRAPCLHAAFDRCSRHRAAKTTMEGLHTHLRGGADAMRENREGSWEAWEMLTGADELGDSVF